MPFGDQGSGGGATSWAAITGKPTFSEYALASSVTGDDTPGTMPVSNGDGSSRRVQMLDENDQLAFTPINVYLDYADVRDNIYYEGQMVVARDYGIAGVANGLVVDDSLEGLTFVRLGKIRVPVRAKAVRGGFDDSGATLNLLFETAPINDSDHDGFPWHVWFRIVWYGETDTVIAEGYVCGGGPNITNNPITDMKVYGNKDVGDSGTLFGTGAPGNQPRLVFDIHTVANLSRLRCRYRNDYDDSFGVYTAQHVLEEVEMI